MVVFVVGLVIACLWLCVCDCACGLCVCGHVVWLCVVPTVAELAVGSGGEHYQRKLAVEVRRGIGEHCQAELAVEVRQGMLPRGIRG